MRLRSIKLLYLSKFCRLLTGTSMLDTVRFNVGGSLKASVLPGQLKKQGVKFFLDDTRRYLCAVECSLPKLLFGYNGRLILSQSEMDAAFEKLFKLVEGYADVPPFVQWTPWRLDPVWQFQVANADAIIDTLSAFRYPDIRSMPWHQAGGGVSWRGVRSRFMISIYNKSVQMGQTGQVLRVEVSLRGGELKRMHGRSWLCFDCLYSVYREIVSHLPEVQVANGRCGWPEAIGKVVPVEFHESILALLNQAERTKRDSRRKMKVARLELKDKFSFKRSLHQGHLPPPVHVEPKKRRKGSKTY